MISKFELGYVQANRKQIPYPGFDTILKVLTTARECILQYDNVFRNHEDHVTFGDGSEVKLKMLEGKLAHLLALDTDQLSEAFKSEALKLDAKKGYSSYSLLTALADNYEDVALYCDTEEHDAFNWHKASVKCAIFEKFLQLRDLNLGCIVFDKNIFDTGSPSNPSKIKSDRLLFMTSGLEVAPYFVMGIMRNGYGKNSEHVVETFMAPQSPCAYFRDQRITNVPQILTVDKEGISHKKEATMGQRQGFLQVYNSIINTYGLDSPLSIAGDYMTLLDAINKPKLLEK